MVKQTSFVGGTSENYTACTMADPWRMGGVIEGYTCSITKKHCPEPYESGTCKILIQHKEEQKSLQKAQRALEATQKESQLESQSQSL